MPKQLESDLKKEAQKKGLTGDKANAYIYGAMRKMGWKPGQGGVKGPKNMGGM